MKRLLIVVLLVTLAAGLGSPATLAAQDPPRPAAGLNPGRPVADGPQAADEAADGRYIVEFVQYRSQSPGLVRALGGEVIHEFPEYASVAARLPDQALRGLRNHPSVRSVEVDPRRYPLATGDITLPSGEIMPYGIAMVQADQLGDAGAATRKVCIIDSGYSNAHDDLRDGGFTPDHAITASPDSGTGDPFTDGMGHGTHVAGTIAAIGNNGVGVTGVMPNQTVKLHIVKVFGDTGWAYSSSLVTALSKCREAGSNVISMSLGGSWRSGLEDRAFSDAYKGGVLSVAAAGNAGDTSVSYPAGYSSVVSVAAVDSAGAVAGFSQKNRDVELAAPGVGVLSTVPWRETNTLAVGSTTYQGNWIQNAARTTGGTSGSLANGGRCTAQDADWRGLIVLCERGDISFFDKVMNVQRSGGAAAVIYNNVPGNFVGTLGDGNASTIPAISLSQEDGLSLVNAFSGGAAPSGTVVSQVVKPGSGYEAWDGTSMATPHVAGVAALVWSYNPKWTNAQIRDALQQTALDKGTAGRDTAYGYGIVQAKTALCKSSLSPRPAVCTP